jgi:hypothetical protein
MARPTDGWHVSRAGADHRGWSRTSQPAGQAIGGDGDVDHTSGAPGVGQHLADEARIAGLVFSSRRVRLAERSPSRPVRERLPKMDSTTVMNRVSDRPQRSCIRTPLRAAMVAGKVAQRHCWAAIPRGRLPGVAPSRKSQRVKASGFAVRRGRAARCRPTRPRAQPGRRRRPAARATSVTADGEFEPSRPRASDPPQERPPQHESAPRAKGEVRLDIHVGHVS